MSFLSTNQRASAAQWGRAALNCAVLVACAMVVAEPALAQVGGATGTGTATGTRVTNVVTQFQGILFAIGAFILTAAFMYVGYGLAWGGKKWSDVANVTYGCLVAGLAPILVGWFFS